MRKVIILVIVFFLHVIVTLAQRERNYVYLFDCTQSMKGYNNQPDIWDQTKKWLWDDIGQLKDGHVKIIPFQGSVYSQMAFDRTDFEQKKIEGKLDEYIKSVTNTNICAAWDAGIKVLDPHKDNYLYVLTDGLDNVSGMAAVCKRIREWCGQHKNSYVFYVMLTKFAKDKALIDAINSCNSVFLIDGDGKHLPPFGAFAGNEITVNTQDYRPQAIGFSAAGTYQTSIQNSDELFDIRSTNISNGKATFTVKPRLDKHSLQTALAGRDVYSFEVKVKGEGLMILNDAIRVNVINKPERTISMVGEEVNAGRASYYGKFLFKDASTPDTLTISLQSVLNDEALKFHSRATMKFHSESLQSDDFILLFNGKEQADKTFVIDEASNNALVSIVFHPDAPFGKHYFTIKTVELKELDRINELEASNFELPVRAIYSRSVNPLLIACGVLLAILLALLVLWFLAIRPVRYVTFKAVRLMLTGEPSLYQNYRIKGAREIRFTKTGLSKQSIFGKIFTGEILFKKNPFENAPDWSIKPRSSRGSKGGTIMAREYELEPTNLITTRDDEPATIKWEGQKIEIKLM